MTISKCEWCGKEFKAGSPSVEGYCSPKCYTESGSALSQKPKERVIVDYKVVVDRVFGFRDEVRVSIQEGWVPLGGVSQDEGISFYQAMVKYETK